jgi:hypothetical protein
MEELDLLEYLIPDIAVYSVIHGRMKTVLRIEPESDFPIIIGTRKKGDRTMRFNRRGSVLKAGVECLLFPDKDTDTWEGYVTPFVFYRGDIVKVFRDDGKALVAIYSHFDREKQLHYCFHSISDTGEAGYTEHSRVDRFRMPDGYLFAKKLISKMAAGKIEKDRKDGGRWAFAGLLP